MIPKVLDATCGSRMIWFDKNYPGALYVDRREVTDETIWKSTKNDSVRRLSVHPDVIADFRDLPFPDKSFYLVVFDPPHLIKIGENAWMCKKYGRLPGDWQGTIRAGFDECWRVLKPNGTLVFKWNEHQIPVREVIAAIGRDPLFGNRSGKQGKTHWMVFFKNENDVCQEHFLNS